MMTEKRQSIIELNVPKLLKLLLESEEEDEAYEESRQFAFARLRHEHYPPIKPCSVIRNLGHFIGRYQSEQLPEFGETIQVLANVVLKEPLLLDHEDQLLRWTLVEFMLSISYMAFKYVRRNREIMEQQRLLIVEQLDQATAKTEPKEQSQSDDTLSRSELDSLVERIRQQRQLSLESQGEGEDDSCSLLSLPQATAPTQSSDFQLRENFATPEAELSFSLALSQPQPAPVKPSQLDYFRSSDELLTRLHTHWWTVDVHVQPKEESEQSFARSYAEYLCRQQQRSLCASAPELNVEGQLLSELLIMFFCPHDCRHFQLIGRLICLRPAASKGSSLDSVLEAQLLHPLRQMHSLRHFIEISTARQSQLARLETQACLGQGLRRLLKPVIEALIDFERRLSAGKQTGTLISFLEAMRQPCERLSLLSELASSCQISAVPHKRTAYALGKLQAATLAGAGQLEAALLLHSLRPYCEFLDHWWQTGEFQDWQAEFPLLKVQLPNGHTSYELRRLAELPNIFPSCWIFELLLSHVKQAGPAIALLYDTRRLGELVRLHESLLQKSLHHAHLEAVLHQLKLYEQSAPPSSQLDSPPDILRLIKAAEDAELQRILYDFYKETQSADPLPPGCAVDQMLWLMERCSPYAPLDQLACQSLTQLLQQRALLANSYTLHLLREELQLAAQLRQLRGVCLLLHYETFQQQFEAIFCSLEQRHFAQAAEQLQRLIAHQSPPLAEHFRVLLTPLASLEAPAIEALTLHYSCDLALEWVVTAPQLAQYEDDFRLLLRAQWATWRLRNLSASRTLLNVPALARLQRLRTSLLVELQVNVRVFRGEVQLSAALLDSRLPRCMSLEQLQEAHASFLAKACPPGFRDGLQEQLPLLPLLEQLWHRLFALDLRQPQPQATQNYLNSVCRLANVLLGFLQPR